MGSTHRFLAIGDESDRVLDWFRSLPNPPQETTPSSRGRWLHFREIGPLAFTGSQTGAGEIDPKRSPVVSFFPARRRRGVLWTAGEVHFLATPLKELFPTLDRVSRQFARWLSQFERVFSRRSPTDDWTYYLEGSILNYDSDVYALPDAAAELRRGQYFVADDDSATAVDTLCRTLRLRGVECSPREDP